MKERVWWTEFLLNMSKGRRVREEPGVFVITVVKADV